MTHRYNKIFDRVLTDISVDHRITNGTFRIEENVHMDVFREYFTNQGIDESLVIEFSNKMLEGKFPERQAYNAKGILVTFPTPEYKANAIKAGTHFEENPTKQASNLFSDPQSPAPATPTPTTPTPKPTAGETQPSPEPKTNLPVSQSKPTTELDPTVQVKTTAAPQQTPPSSSPTDPEKEPPDPPVEKSPEEKEAEKNAIKAMLRSDDYMLEESEKNSDITELYESANKGLNIIMSFISGNLPKKNEVLEVAKKLQSSINKNSRFKL